MIETDISRAILEEYNRRLLEHLENDVVIVGAGPAGLAAGYYLAAAGVKTTVLEKKLSPCFQNVATSMCPSRPCGQIGISLLCISHYLTDMSWHHHIKMAQAEATHMYHQLVMPHLLERYFDPCQRLPGCFRFHLSG